MTTGTRTRKAESSPEVSGTSHCDTEFTADEESTEPVQRCAASFVNGLLGRELRVDYAWAGIFGIVMDFLPVVGPVPELEDVWVAGGYSGHGNVLGFACGSSLRRRSLGDSVPFLDVFEPARLLNLEPEGYPSDLTTASARVTRADPTAGARRETPAPSR